MTTVHKATDDASESLCGFRASERTMGVFHIVTCKRCLAIIHCREGIATHEDRLLLAHRGLTTDNAAIMFGPVEKRIGKPTCNAAPNCRDINCCGYTYVRATWRHTMDAVTPDALTFETITTQE